MSAIQKAVTLKKDTELDVQNHLNMIPNTCCKKQTKTLLRYTSRFILSWSWPVAPLVFVTLKVMSPASTFIPLAEMDVENLMRIHATMICGSENMPCKSSRNPCPLIASFSLYCSAIKAAL